MTEYKKLEHHILSIGGGVNLSLTEFVYDSGIPGKKMYIQSGLHGGETSQWVLYKLHAFLMNNLSSGEVHVVAYANPAAWLQRTYYSTAGKFSLIDGKDYNRCFSDSSGADVNSLICGAIAKLAGKCDFVIDLHTSKMSAPFAIYTKPEYAPYVKAIGLRYNQFSDDAAVPALHGTFNAWLDRRHIPNVTIECGSHDEYDAKKIELVFNGLTSLLAFLSGQENASTKADLYRFDTRKKIYAPTAGLIKYLKNPGDFIKKGDFVAELFSADELSETQLVTAEENGVLHVLNPGHIVWQGDIVAEIIPQDNLSLL